MILSDEQLIRTLTDLGGSREFATSAIFRDRWAAIVIHEAVQRAQEGDVRSACLVDGARTMFALLTGDLKASPASSCDFDDDAVAREREVKYMWQPRVGPLGLRIHLNRPRGLYLLWRLRPYCIFDRQPTASSRQQPPPAAGEPRQPSA